MDAVKLARRNTLLMVIEGTLFWAGLAFLQGDTVVSKFINATTGSVALAGLAATLRSVMFLVGQFVAGMFIHRIRVQSRFMRIWGFIDRPLMLLMVPILLTKVDGPIAAAAFLVLISLFCLFDGVLSLAWMEICTRTLPLQQRGVVSSVTQAFAGVMGIAIAEVCNRALNAPWPMEHQYALIFGLSGTIMLINSFALAGFRDLPHSSDPTRKVQNPFRYAKSLLPLFTKNRSARLVLIARVMYVMALISAPTNMMFAISVAGFTEAQQSVLLFIPFIGQIVAGVMWAQASKRLNYPIIMALSQTLGIACALMNLLTYALTMSGLSVVVPLSLTMALISINTPSYFGYTQQLIAIVDEETRPQYIVMSALILAPFSFGTFLAGIIVERFGYLPVYLIMLACGVTGFWVVYHFFLSKKSPLPADHRSELRFPR